MVSEADGMNRVELSISRLPAHWPGDSTDQVKTSTEGKSVKHF